MISKSAIYLRSVQMARFRLLKPYLSSCFSKCYVLPFVPRLSSLVFSDSFFDIATKSTMVSSIALHCIAFSALFHACASRFYASPLLKTTQMFVVYFWFQKKISSNASAVHSSWDSTTTTPTTNLQLHWGFYDSKLENGYVRPPRAYGLA